MFLPVGGAGREPVALRVCILRVLHNDAIRRRERVASKKSLSKRPTASPRDRAHTDPPAVTIGNEVGPNAAASVTADPVASPAATFPIVGIGASAGGLAAYEAFFGGLPEDQEMGMAFVIVQHLSPDHKSGGSRRTDAGPRKPVSTTIWSSR